MSNPTDGLAETIAELEAYLGTEGVLSRPQDMGRYRRDWSGDYEGTPAAVIRPRHVSEVSEAIKICNRREAEIVPQGGHTGLVGGATADRANQIVLSLEKMDRIRSLDPLGMSMVVEAGCVLQTAKDYAERSGCFFPLSLGAQGSCQIGGNISTNAGGVNVLRYGMMRSLVLGLEAVFPDGRIYSDLRALRKNNTGLDLKQLFIGTEGTLGIVTAATLKLYSKPRWVETAWVSADNIADIMQLFGYLRGEAGDFLSAFELMTPPCLDLALELDSGVSLVRNEVKHFAAHALVEFSSSGGPDLKPWITELIANAFEQGLAKAGIVAQSASHSKMFWRIRELMVEAQQKRGLHLRTDVSVPISSISPFIAKVTQAVEKTLPGSLVVAYGHVGDGNIHVNVLPPEDFNGFQGKLGALTATINEVVDGFDGSISAEHGIGITKREEFAKRIGETHLDMMKMIKRSIDPKNVLSPGRIFRIGPNSARGPQSVEMDPRPE
jgi:FAD/FMN-containing dehydrogenase